MFTRFVIIPLIKLLLDPVSLFPFPHSPVPLLPFPIPSPSRFLSFHHSPVPSPSWFLPFPFSFPSPSQFLACPCSLSVSPCSLSVSLAKNSLTSSLCVHKEAGERSQIQGARGLDLKDLLLLPSSPPSLPRLLVLITLGLGKKREQGLIFNKLTDPPFYFASLDSGRGNREGLFFAEKVWGFCFD